jgi:hypothetical protein
MKKYRIELSEQQMRLIADCLEDVSRFASGQWEMRCTIEEMLRGLPFDEQMKRRGEVEEVLKQAKRVLLPEFPDNASKGYNGSEFIGNTYQYIEPFYTNLQRIMIGIMYILRLLCQVVL